MAITNDPNAPIRFSAIREEFGGTAPDYLSEYYRGGANVPNDAGDGVVGVTEVQTITPTGTRSNVVLPGQNEFITIEFDDRFDGGFNQANTTVTLGNLGSVEHDSTASWPTGSATPTVTGAGSSSDWSYEPGIGGSSSSTTGEVLGVLRYNGTDTIDIAASSITAVVNITSLDSSITSADPNFVVRSTESSVVLFIASIGTVTEPTTITYIDTSPAISSVSQIRTGEGIRLYLEEFSSTKRPFTYEVVSVEFNTGLLQTTQYDFDIDTSGAHFPGTGGTVDIDFTNASGDGTTGNIVGAIYGSWLTDNQSGIFNIPQPTTPTTLSNVIFNLMSGDPNLRDDISILRGTGIGDSFVQDNNGLVVRVLSTEGFDLFFRQANTAAFNWDSTWGVIPTIYADGVEYPTEDVDGFNVGTPPVTAGSFHAAAGNFPINTTTGLLAAQHLHDQIEATYTGVTVEGPTAVAGVGGILDIDCTNADSSSSSSFNSNYLLGDWYTYTGNPELPVWTGRDAAGIAAEFIAHFTSADTNADVTFERGIGVGDSFVADASGLVVRLQSSVNGFFFLMRTGTGIGPWSFFSPWDQIPTFYANGVDQQIESGTQDVIQIGSVNRHQIVVDTGFDEDVSDASLTITENTGSRTEPVTFVVADGVPSDNPQPHSTTTVNDYNGNEVTMFTTSVIDPTASDLSLVKDRAISAINDNVETPVNFDAENGNGSVVITADQQIAVDGTWSITTNHNNAAAGDIGDIAFGEPVVVEGVAPVTATLINQNVPTSGPITTDDFRGAYDPDNPVNS